jgi:hypothetical protein
MTTKISKLRESAAGKWTEALRMAARFPRLGDERTAILRAWNAHLRPEFYRQLRQDPEAVVAAGIANACGVRADRLELPSSGLGIVADG